jgi:hypothetical protein
VAHVRKRQCTIIFGILHLEYMYICVYIHTNMCERERERVSESVCEFIRMYMFIRHFKGNVCESVSR